MTFAELLYSGVQLSGDCKLCCHVDALYLWEV